MNSFLLAASAASFITFAIHTWLGGPAAARPLLKSGMHDVPKYTNYYCWHLVTLTLLAMSAGFLWAATSAHGLDVGWLVYGLSASFMLWNLVLIVWKKQSFFEMPQWILFLAITALATFGLI
jgi:hypothetical protein